MAGRQAILTGGDYALVQASLHLAPLLRMLGRFEEDLFGADLHRIEIEAPIFVTGLARSGTTMMLTLLSQAAGVATHRYRDFPFLFAPLAWNRFQDFMRPAAAEAVERPHRDRIRITRESPEAFEEPLWQAFFPVTHDPARYHVLGPDTQNSAFEACFGSHLRKILWLRAGTRYLSKGNYNATRIGYLSRLFPDARFVVPIREPLAHVQSLVRQHQLFCAYASQDARVPAYLAAAGHYEFGPQRRPINADPARIGEIERAWRSGDDYRGYARQWAQVYLHVDRLRREERLGRRLRVVRYEDACAGGEAVSRELLEFCGLSDPDGRVRAAAAKLVAPPPEPVGEREAHAVREEAASVASLYGYR